MPICILEAKIVLGVLYRKGVIPKKGGTLDFRETWALFVKLAQRNFAGIIVMGHGRGESCREPHIQTRACDLIWWAVWGFQDGMEQQEIRRNKGKMTKKLGKKKRLGPS